MTKLKHTSIIHDEFDKYAYVTNTWLVRFIYLFGIISWFMVMLGFFNFLNLNSVYWFLFAPFLLLYSMSNIFNYGLNLFYKQPDMEYHKKINSDFISLENKPIVDVFLPVAGEGIEYIKRTWSHVQKLNYSNYRVYVLDDKGDVKLQNLAAQYGFNYLSRPNKGEWKKAGNLNYGYQNSNGKYVVVFDADFCPHEDFINETIPYMELDTKISILQTPQYFEKNDSVHDENHIMYGLASMQEEFYKIVQVSRNYFKSAICVGTNAVYRRKAIEDCGGTPLVEHSEDVFTGCKTVSKGYYVKYLPFILAQGYCPESFISLFKQQYRWCRGCMNLLLTGTVFKLPIPIVSMFGYISGFLYYLISMMQYFFPLMLICLLLNNYESVSISQGLLFLPHIIFIFLILPWQTHHNPFLLGTYISAKASSMSHFYGLVHTFFNRNMHWVPSGDIIKNDRSFNRLFIFNICYTFGYMTLAILLIKNGYIQILNLNYLPIFFWLVFSFIIDCLVISSIFKQEYLFTGNNSIFKHIFTSLIVIVVTGLSIGMLTSNISENNSKQALASSQQEDINYEISNFKTDIENLQAIK